MAKIFSWGIIGPGHIAQKFAKAIALVPDARLAAVASRDLERARSFASEFGADKAFGNYASLAEDPDIDAIYIATPHTYHHVHTLLCIGCGKPVLVEKPMSVSFASTQEMVSRARESRIFLMEAMWTGFLPSIRKVVELVAAGTIGEVKSVRADFGFAGVADDHSRLYDLSLGGGSLLDVGVYPLYLALLLLGRPDAVKTVAQLASSGADVTTEALLYYAGGKTASIQSSIVMSTSITAEITGTTGAIRLERPWYKGSMLSVRRQDEISETFSLPYGDNGFEFQIQEVQHCLSNGFMESGIMPLDMSLLLAETMETINRSNGVAYALQSAVPAS